MKTGDQDLCWVAVLEKIRSIFTAETLQTFLESTAMMLVRMAAGICSQLMLVYTPAN